MVGAGAGDDPVVPLVAMDLVVIGPRPGDRRIATIERVIPWAPVETIPPAPAPDDVVAGLPADHVIARCADQRVVPGPAPDRALEVARMTERARRRRSETAARFPRTGASTSKGTVSITAITLRPALGRAFTAQALSNACPLGPRVEMTTYSCNDGRSLPQRGASARQLRVSERRMLNPVSFVMPADVPPCRRGADVC